MSHLELVQMLRSRARKSGAQTSNFRGVSLLKQTGKWHAQINVAGRQVHLGFYYSEEAAARAYDRAAINKGAREGSKIITNFAIEEYEQEVEILRAITQEELISSLSQEAKRKRMMEVLLHGDLSRTSLLFDRDVEAATDLASVPSAADIINRAERAVPKLEFLHKWQPPPHKPAGKPGPASLPSPEDLGFSPTGCKRLQASYASMRRQNNRYTQPKMKSPGRHGLDNLIHSMGQSTDAPSSDAAAAADASADGFPKQEADAPSNGHAAAEGVADADAEAAGALSAVAAAAAAAAEAVEATAAGGSMAESGGPAETPDPGSAPAEAGSGHDERELSRQASGSDGSLVAAGREAAEPGPALPGQGGGGSERGATNVTASRRLTPRQQKLRELASQTLDSEDGEPDAGEGDDADELHAATGPPALHAGLDLEAAGQALPQHLALYMPQEGEEATARLALPSPLLCEVGGSPGPCCSGPARLQSGAGQHEAADEEVESILRPRMAGCPPKLSPQEQRSIHARLTDPRALARAALQWSPTGQLQEGLSERDDRQLAGFCSTGGTTEALCASPAKRRRALNLEEEGGAEEGLEELRALPSPSKARLQKQQSPGRGSRRGQRRQRSAKPVNRVPLHAGSPELYMLPRHVQQQMGLLGAAVSPQDALGADSSTPIPAKLPQTPGSRPDTPETTDGNIRRSMRERKVKRTWSPEDVIDQPGPQTPPRKLVAGLLEGPETPSPAKQPAPAPALLSPAGQSRSEPTRSDGTAASWPATGMEDASLRTRNRKTFRPPSRAAMG